MSSHSVSKIDQKEYLKKYLSGDKAKKKKKHKKSSKDSVKVKIIDDDINHVDNGPEIDEELLLTGDDAPQIVGEYIEEHPTNQKQPKWKSIVIKDEPEEDESHLVIGNEDSLWGRKASEVKQTFSINKKRSNRTPDNSPIRKKDRRRKSFSTSPPRRQRKTSSPANSPDRKPKIKSEPLSPQNTHNDRKDLFDDSPPRKKGFAQSAPPRRRKNSTQSPPSRSRHFDRSPDKSPTRRRSSDQSPARKYKNSKLLPPAPHRKAPSDKSPSRRGPSTDLSPPRRRIHDSVQSPTSLKRKLPMETRIKVGKRTPELSPQRSKPSRWEKSPSPPPTHKPKPSKTLEGKQSGLQNAQALQIEIKERRNRENLLFETMSSDISGRNAEVQVRSTGRKGRRAREAADEDPEERRRKEEHEEKKKQQYDRWGKGLKQIEDHKNRILQQEYESSKPLARYANDEDLERHLKEQEIAGDPMLEYMRQKRIEKEKQSGKPVIPRYEGSYPENRFGIRPGYRWDGVDRSNGYEKKYFAVQTEKQARQNEAYKYSVEDM